MAMGLRFDGQKVAFDMAGKPWDVQELAKKARLSDRTVYRFINNELQTLATARAIAKALGFSTKRYLLPVETTTGAKEESLVGQAGGQ
jgi:transcriptional regulator with XRE-family HTH domain